MSTCAITQPPNMSPAALTSAGIGITLNTGCSAGKFATSSVI